MDSIYLIGFMGSGKTTTASLLAKKCGFATQDTDQMVEAHYQLSIKEIFAKYGEDTFRTYEQQMLQRTRLKNTVISTGGGIIERQENRTWLRTKQVIYLRTSWEEIVRRLKNSQNRPIWNDQNTDKKALLDLREEKYIQASSHIIDTDEKTINEIVDEIMELIRIKK